MPSMAFKNISLSVDAYERLKKMKKENESFSEEVMRLTSGERLSELAGTLTDEQAQEYKKNVEEVKKAAKVRSWHS